jgi:hypothetical protein
MDMQIDPDALIAPNLLQQMESSPSGAPKRLPPPLPPARRSSSDAPSGQMSISTKLLVVILRCLAILVLFLCCPSYLNFTNNH